jgi:hypothetical protein
VPLEVSENMIVVVDLAGTIILLNQWNIFIRDRMMYGTSLYVHIEFKCYFEKQEVESPYKDSSGNNYTA